MCHSLFLLEGTEKAEVPGPALRSLLIVRQVMEGWSSQSGGSSRLILVSGIKKGTSTDALSSHPHSSSAIGYGRNLFRKLQRRSPVGRLRLRFDGAYSSACVPRANPCWVRAAAIVVDSLRIDPRSGRKDGNKRVNLHRSLGSWSPGKINNGLLLCQIVKPRGGAEQQCKMGCRGSQRTGDSHNQCECTP